MHSRLTAKSQTTIPKRVREWLGLKPGDAVKYEIEGGRVILSKATAADVAYLAQLEKALGEWDAPEDALAHDNL